MYNERVKDRYKDGKVLFYCNYGESEVYMLDLETGDNHIIAIHSEPETIWDKPLYATFDKDKMCKSVRAVKYYAGYNTVKELLATIDYFNTKITINVEAARKYIMHLRYIANEQTPILFKGCGKIGTQIYKTNNCELWEGDCLEVMEQIKSGSIDMILCDLPYGTTKCKWDSIIPFEYLWKQYNRLIKSNGSIVLFGSEPFSSKLRLSAENMYRYDWIWKKNKATQYLNAKKMPLLDYETLSVFYKTLPTYNPIMTEGKAYSNSHKPGDSGECYGKVGYSEVKNKTTRYPKRIIEFGVDMKAEYHPTQKPIPLLEYLIRTYTDEGETVLDNCMGSGSTGVAAINTNRKFIGIELDTTYCGIAKERIQHIVSDIT